MGRKHLFPVGVFIHLLIFIIGGPQVGGGGGFGIVNAAEIPATGSGAAVSGLSIKDESPSSRIVGKNFTRSKLWSPYSTVVSTLLRTTIYEDPAEGNSGIVNQPQTSSSPHQTQQQQQQGPLISNIRHYKSRKSFSRVKTTFKPPPLPQLSGKKKVKDETQQQHDHDDWQGDEGIPTTEGKNENESDVSIPQKTKNKNDTAGSVVYGKPTFRKFTPSSSSRKVSSSSQDEGRMENFTKIDQIKTFLSQNKNSSTAFNSSSPFPSRTSSSSSSPEGSEQRQKYYDEKNPSVYQNISKLKNNSNSKILEKNEKSYSMDHRVQKLNSNHSAAPLLPADYQSVSENFNDDDYYEIPSPPHDPKTTTSNNNHDNSIYVPGMFPTFYEEGDIKEEEEEYDKIHPYEEIVDVEASQNFPTSKAGAGSEENTRKEPEAHGPPSITIDEKAEMDVVSKFLRIIEERTPENCTAGVDLTLGKGVVDRYAQDRFRREAEVAVNRANMLTRLWKYAPHVMASEYLLHASVISIIEFDETIFAAGNCYDGREYKNYRLFCPFGHRLPEGDILVKDLALEYDYLGNTSEFFFAARKSAERIISSFNQFRKGYHMYPYNDTEYTPKKYEDIILNVTYEDGKWSMPYFDCGGGNIWMMTYTVPFFGFRNSTYYFKGTSGIDIDLRRVDIDQCPIPDNSSELNIFASSDKCKKATTKCVHAKGMGFRRGSYRCECRPGFYFPNVSSSIKYFNGSVLEEEYENKFMRKFSRYDEVGAFECLACPSGCEVCEDDSPCVVTLNWIMRSAILILQSAIILMLPLVGLFTWKYSEAKVVRAASPLLLRFIVLGAFFIYCTTLVMYPSPSIITCTLQVWLREIGFSLAYGALLLKTWRISVIFRVRSAKAVKITDLDLMKRLGIIVGMFTVLLAIRTLVAPPVSIVSYTSDELKAWLCKSDWWDHSFTIMELSFLVWGIRLCIVVRKAPSEFNESKFISLAIYNEFLLSLFLNISMLFLQSPANPDLLYIIFFCHVQLTMTLLLCLIFGSKAYMVFRGHGKGGGGGGPDELRGAPANKFIKGRGAQSAVSGQNSTGMNCRFNASISTGHEQGPKFPEDVQEEFRRLYSQLEELKERNMRLGNRHLVAKITAMQEAADNMLSGSGGSDVLGVPTLGDAQYKQIAIVAGSSGSCSFCPSSPVGGGGIFSSVLPGSNISSTASSPRGGKSMGILSDISEDENPSSSGAETGRLGTCQATDKSKDGSGARRRSIPPQSQSTSSPNNSSNGGNLRLQGELTKTASSPSSQSKGTTVPAGSMNSPNEAQVDETKTKKQVKLDSQTHLNIEKDDSKPEEPTSCSSITNDDSHGNAKMDNEVDVLDTGSNLKTSAKGRSNSPGSQIDEGAGEKQQPPNPKQQSNCIPSQEAQDPKSTSGESTATATGAAGSPSKMILDLNDKSRFTEEITV